MSKSYNKFLKEHLHDLDPDERATLIPTGRVSRHTHRYVVFEGDKWGVTQLAKKFGMEKFVLTGRLYNGWSVEESVRPEKREDVRLLDLTGQKRGCWSVLGISKDRNRLGKRVFLCRCDGCGMERERTATSILKNLTCKCQRPPSPRRKEPFGWITSTVKWRAERRGIVFDLTTDDILPLTQRPNCFYCEVPLVWSPYRSQANQQGATNIDRMDNSLGYVKGNIVQCCKKCNFCKNQWFSHEDFIEIGKTIRRLREGKLTVASGEWSV